MMNFLKNTVKRLPYALATMAIITVCIIYANCNGLTVPITSVIGAYISVIIIAAVLINFPMKIYISALIFDIFAATFGSILRFYDNIPLYDRYIHFASGIILADIGYYLINYIFHKNEIKPLPRISLLFAVLFSFAAAGLWEVYEFSADNLLNTQMQGSNLDTMGDIVSGVLGGLAYLIIASFYFFIKSEKS